MNNKISALKKKIELKEHQLDEKLKCISKNKEAAKAIKADIEALRNELAREEMSDIMALIDDKKISIDDVKAAIVSGVIAPSAEDEMKEVSETDDDVIKEDSQNA